MPHYFFSWEEYVLLKLREVKELLEAEVFTGEDKFD